MTRPIRRGYPFPKGTRRSEYVTVYHFPSMVTLLGSWRITIPAEKATGADAEKDVRLGPSLVRLYPIAEGEEQA